MAREAVYTTRFIQAKELTTSEIYTVLPGFVLVVRDVTAFMGVQLAVSAGTLRGGAGQAIFRWETGIEEVGEPTYHHWEGRQVLYEGEVLEALQELGNADVSVTGYLLGKE